MRAGAAIGIPLTLLQWGVHQHTGAPVDAWTVANNFLVASAVYDADRIDAPLLSRERLGTRVSLLGACAYYASDVHTAWLAAVAATLHLGYGALKPLVAPVKPFFVALFWVVAVYYVPAWRSVDAHVELLTPAALFLSIASLSQAADVVDLDEDRAAGVRTPAVRMGGAEGAAYAATLALAAAFLHSQSPSDLLLYDALALASVLGIVTRRPDATALAGLAFLLAHVQHDVPGLLEGLLTSSKASHEIAIDHTIRAVALSEQLDEPWRARLLDVVFGLANAGDAFGHRVFQLYEHVLRHRP